MLAKDYLTSILQSVVSDLGYSWPDKVTIEPPKDKNFGDFAVNCALVLAKQVGKPPRDLAAILAEKLQAASQHIGSVSVAGPGFLNIVFSPKFWQD